MTRRNNQTGSISRHRGWWVLRYREASAVGGVVKTVLRARRLVPVDSQHKTRASVRQLAAELLQPLNRLPVSPLGVTTLKTSLNEYICHL